MFYPDEEKKPRVHLPGVMSDEGPVFNIEGILTIQSGSRAMCAHLRVEGVIARHIG